MRNQQPYQGNVSTKKWGPIPNDHPVVKEGLQCPGCTQRFVQGNFITAIVIGPGTDKNERRMARTGSTYTAVTIPAHWECVTGEIDHLEMLTSGEQPPN